MVILRLVEPRIDRKNLKLVHVLHFWFAKNRKVQEKRVYQLYATVNMII